MEVNRKVFCKETKVNWDQVICAEKNKSYNMAIARKAALKGLRNTKEDDQTIHRPKSTMNKQKTWINVSNTISDESGGLTRDLKHIL